jgi:hypothetical protein
LHRDDEIGHQAAEQAEHEGDLTEALHCPKIGLGTMRRTLVSLNLPRGYPR